MNHKLKIKTNGAHAEMYLDEQPIADKCKSYHIEIWQKAGELPSVSLDMMTDVEFEGEVKLSKKIES